MRRKGQFQSPLSTHCFVERFIDELELIKPVTMEKQTVQRSEARWIRPPSGLAKINVDVSVSKT